MIAGISRTRDFSELVKLTAKRSAYPDHELKALAARGVVTAIDFLLVGHLEQQLSLGFLTSKGILRGPPQSVTSITDYAALKRAFDLGFQV